MTDSSGLADLRDQIVRLQQRWRARSVNQWGRRMFGDGHFDTLALCADDLDPLLTLVRSIVEAQKAEEE
jgi:hypothetical protein